MRPVVAQGHKYNCKRDRLWVRFPLEKFNIYIFALAKPGYQFCYTTCNAFRVRQKARNSSKGLNGKKCLSTRFSLLALMCAGYNVKLKNKYIYNAL